MKIHMKGTKNIYISNVCIFVSGLRPLFLIGSSSQNNTSLHQEFNSNGDILLISAAEGYGRISYKTAAGFIWASCFCSNVNYVLKIDDDVSVRYDYVTNILENNFSQGQSLTVQCPSVMRNMRPWRPRKSGSNTFMGKWSVKTYEMPRRVFPSFCPGWLYATTPKMAIRLAEMASNLSPDVQAVNRLDDIYMTGKRFSKKYNSFNDTTCCRLDHVT